MNPMAFKLTMRQWQLIDGQMDNSAFMARQNPVEDEDGEPMAADALPMAIRQAGWDQIALYDGTPADAVVQVGLARGQWEYVVSELRASDAVYEQLGDDESVQLGRDVVAAVERQLGV